MLPVNPARIKDMMTEAQRFQAARNWAKARKGFEAILAIRDDLPEVHFRLGQVLLHLRQFEESTRHLDRAADLKPAERMIWEQYAIVIARLSDPTKTAAFLRKAKKAKIDRGLLMALQDKLKPSPAKSTVAIGTAPPEDIQKAIAHLKAGRREQAAALAGDLRRAHPDVAIVADILALAQAELGQHAEAEQNFRSAITLDPTYAETRANFGQFLLNQGRYDQAIAELSEAVRLQPNLPSALTSLGAALCRLYRFDKAIPILRRALLVDSGRKTARSELATALLAKEEPEQVEDLVRPFLDDDLPGSNFRVALAMALAAQQRNAEAELEYDKALAASPRSVLALAGKATLMQLLGRFEEGEKLLRDCISIYPKNGQFYQSLVVTRKIEPGDPIIQDMMQQYQDRLLTNESRMYFGFALAKALEDVKEYGRVFEYLKPANDYMNLTHPFDIAEWRKRIDEIIEISEPVEFSSRHVPDATDFAPIFVTGPPRSGTTLVEQIVSSHPDVTGGGEIAIGYHETRDVLRASKQEQGRAVFPSDKDLAAIGRRTEQKMRALVPDANIITDKGVETYQLLGPLSLALPLARFVLVRRDPRDTLLSMYKNLFAPGKQLYTYNLRQLGEFYLCFVRLVEFWHRKLPGAIHEIQYEDLIANPEAEARKLIAACGLDWDDRCLAFHENKRRVDTLSVHQVRQPLYASSMKAWQRYESDLEELFESLGPDHAPRAADLHKD